MMMIDAKRDRQRQKDESDGRTTTLRHDDGAYDLSHSVLSKAMKIKDESQRPQIQHMRSELAEVERQNTELDADEVERQSVEIWMLLRKIGKLRKVFGNHSNSKVCNTD